MTLSDRRAVRWAALKLALPLVVAPVGAAAMVGASYTLVRQGALGRIPGSNPTGKGGAPYLFYDARARIVPAAARRQHVIALVARFRREAGRWPRNGGELARRFGDRQRVPARDADHPALDYQLGGTLIRYLGPEGTGARMLVRVPDFDTEESVVAPDEMYPPKPVRL